MLALANVNSFPATLNRDRKAAPVAQAVEDRLKAHLLLVRLPLVARLLGGHRFKARLRVAVK